MHFDGIEEGLVGICAYLMNLCGIQVVLVNLGSFQVDSGESMRF